MQRVMNRAKTAFALLLVFCAGCAAERLLVVPPARAGTSPQRWEYACGKNGTFDEPQDLVKTANNFGAEGWELIGFTGAWYCFKRPLP
jgi:hypothetical protein